MNILIPIIVLAAVAGIYYYRFRDHFFEIASATDSKRSNVFWGVVAIVFSIVVMLLYIIFRQHA